MSPAEALLRSVVVRARAIQRIRPDVFVVCLVGTVIASTLVPCDGAGALLFHALGTIAIGSLFFLQGARLSRDAIVSGLTHWRLHVTSMAATFICFPLLGLALHAALPHALPAPLWVGVLFACALPSTVQSSIALTSIAKGNVAGTVCSATISSLAGIIVTPLLFGMMSRLHGGTINAQGIEQIVLQLLLPFVAGHLLRPWIGGWAARNRAMLSITDRGSILLVVYTAFSAAVVHGVWHQVPLATMAVLGCMAALLLASGLLIAVALSRVLGLCTADEVTVVFCGSQKSLVSGVPIATALFGAASVGPLLLPIMIYHPLQLLVCVWLARRYATGAAPALSDGYANIGLAVADRGRRAEQLTN
jgi:sodium/bile acid cotransporter 7